INSGVELASPVGGLLLLARKLLHAPFNVLLTSVEVLFRPVQFASRRIDVGPRDLHRACYFYLNLFTLAFLIGTSLNYLDFDRGESQPRELALFCVQIGMALPLIYFFNICARQRVTFTGITQAVLYLDGIFIVLQNVMTGAIAYVSFTQAV